LKLKFNPFRIYSITEYDQYKTFPVLENDTLKFLRNSIESQIREGFMFPERMIVIGDRGIGKSSSLFFIRDLLEKTGDVNVFMFTQLITDSTDFFNQTKINFDSASQKTMFLLVDFPDTIIPSQFKKFLEHIWNLMTHRNYKNINLVFAMNPSHYNFSFSISELLGKFTTRNLIRMTREETERLIKLRLSLAGNKDFFEDKIYDLIYKYSKGIPRNIICACNSLIDPNIDKDKISLDEAKEIIIDTYAEKIIKDRVDEEEEREELIGIYNLIRNFFNGKVISQTMLSNECKSKLALGTNKTLKLTKLLVKFGLLNSYREGERNHIKVLSTT